MEQYCLRMARIPGCYRDRCCEREEQRGKWERFANRSLHIKSIFLRMLIVQGLEVQNRSISGNSSVGVVNTPPHCCPTSMIDLPPTRDFQVQQEPQTGGGAVQRRVSLRVASSPRRTGCFPSIQAGVNPLYYTSGSMSAPLSDTMAPIRDQPSRSETFGRSFLIGSKMGR